MTYQEILEGITRHRANAMRVNQPSLDLISQEVSRKFDEIEWALQALAEKLRDDDVIWQQMAKQMLEDVKRK